MTRLARFVLRHRRLILLTWLVLFIAGAATAGTTTSRLKFDFSLPGQAGYETGQKIVKTYGNGGEQQPSILVLRSSNGQPIPTPAADAAFAAVQQQIPAVRVVGHATTDDASFVVDGGRTQYALAFTPVQRSFTSPVTLALPAVLAKAAPPGSTGTTTGLQELSDSGGSSGGPGVLAETLIGAVGALAVLAFVFASLLALVPLAIAGVAILTTFLVLLGVTYLTDVSFVVQFLVSLIGLGVAIDYSLLLVTRWREERAKGLDSQPAMVRAIETSGHAIVFSGVTVAVGLAALIALPVPFLRSVGLGGMLIPRVSTMVTLTLLPALLTTRFGQKVDWPHRPLRAEASRPWSRWGTRVVRHRWPAAILALVILGLLVAPLARLSIGLAQSDSLAKSGPAYEALHALEGGGVPSGVLTPIEVLTTAAAAPATVDRLRGVQGVTSAYAPTGPANQRAGTAAVIAIPSRETANGSSVAVVRRVKATLQGAPGVVGVTGVGALQLDYLHGVYGNFPLMLTLIVVVTYLLLVRAFRSLLLPLKAVLLNLLSVGATFGGAVLFWQDGLGSQAVYGIKATGAITFWLPIMVFAFLFGLSMDYEVFILARVREEYDNGASTDGAVIEGIGRTGRLVTSAALILFLSFASLSTGPQTDIKLFATALGFGILLDATVVRALLVPALVSLFGRWNWYLPSAVAKVLRVQPSYPRPEPRRGQVPAEPEREPVPTG